MRFPLEHVQQESPAHLARHLGLPEEPETTTPRSVSRDVLALDLGDRTFLLAGRGSGSSPSVALAIERLRTAAEPAKGRARPIPVVVVPYMGEAGQRLCVQAGVGWLDLSGNAHIEAPGLRIHVEGKPNLFKRRGRPENPFAPKSARVPRHLLNHPERGWTQKGIAEATELTPTYVSRVVRRLEEVRLLLRDSESRDVRPRDPDFLLDAWAERYRFDGHQILGGHVSVSSTDALRSTIIEACAVDGYAFTALPAAWLRDRFASYRMTTVYLRVEPSPRFLEAIGFVEGSRGANLWLVTPNDEGVFQDCEVIEKSVCVSAVQTYLDLLHHAERAKEAAAHLRERHLNWKSK